MYHSHSFFPLLPFFYFTISFSFSWILSFPHPFSYFSSDLLLFFEIHVVLWWQQRWLNTKLAWLMTNSHTNNCNIRCSMRTLLERYKTKSFIAGRCWEEGLICLWRLRIRHFFIHSSTMSQPLSGTENTIVNNADMATTFKELIC
jgi:hypothetical protein